LHPRREAHFISGFGLPPTQARRQDLAAGGGQKPDGWAKNQKGGPHF